MAGDTFYAVQDGFWDQTGPDEYTTGANYVIVAGPGASQEWCGFVRFLNVTIPRYSDITGVYVRFKCWTTKACSGVNQNVHFNAEDDAAIPASAGAAQALSLTGAVGWTLGDWVENSFYNTPSLVSILQDIVDRSGWRFGNAAMLVTRYSSGGASQGMADGYEWGPGISEAELIVTWDAPDPIPINVLATTASLIIAPQAAEISNDIEVSAEAASLIIAPQTALVGLNVIVLAETASLIITSQRAGVAMAVLAETASLIITALPADILIRPHGTLTLINSLKVGGTLTLINSLNVQVTGSMNLVNNILQKIEGTLTLRNDIEERAKFGGTLNLINHILDDDSGITQGDYYFLKSHGI